MARLQGILCLLWCLAVLADADATLAAGATAGHSVCSFNLMGFGNRPGIKFASLSCTGGTVTVAAHKVLKEFWGQQAPSRAQARPYSTWPHGDVVRLSEKQGHHPQGRLHLM